MTPVFLKSLVLLWLICLAFWSALVARAFAVFPSQSREQLKVAAWCTMFVAAATAAAFLADGFHIGKYSIAMAFVGLISGALNYKQFASAARGIIAYRST